jgi:putative transcriptional regulator
VRTLPEVRIGPTDLVVRQVTLREVRPLSSRLQFTLLIVSALLLLGLFSRWREWVQAQERSGRRPEAGLFLVARQGSADRNFDKTVVLLVEVTPERAWGLVLNRLRTPGGEELPAGVNRWGGPVRPERRTTLIRSQAPVADARHLLSGLFWREGPAPEGLPHESSLSFAGLSAWGPGQLESELGRGGWVLVEGSAAKVFSDPVALWAECITPHL